MGTAFTRSNFHVGIAARRPVDRRNERPERGRSPDALARMAVTARLGKARPGRALRTPGRILRYGLLGPRAKSATSSQGANLRRVRPQGIIRSRRLQEGSASSHATIAFVAWSMTS